MFDFSPVGAVTALVGVVFIVLVGWRLIPVEKGDEAKKDAPLPHEDYVAEVRVAENSTIVGQRVRDLDDEADEADVAIVGLVRKGKRLPGRARMEEVRQGDLLVIEADAEHIDAFVGLFKLEYVGSEKYDGHASEGLSLVEAVVPENARIEGRSALSLRLLYRHGVTLLGVSRRGRTFRDRVRKLDTKAGDVLLLLGPSERIDDVVAWLGCLPLQQRDLQVVQRNKAWIAVASFALAIAAATSGLMHLPEALALVCIVMVGFNIVPLKEIYTSIEWPVIVLLGSMIPIGSALEASGGTALIAQQIIDFAAGYGPVIVLTLLMIVTMTLSDVLNNTATTVIAAPIAIDIAGRLSVNPDPFLMAVAIAASCAFLTPIGHKNNTLIMGPGGYRFGDYWRMGLPLEVIVIVTSIPMILLGRLAPRLH
jgi:di/tricarboxylate transporter